MWDKVGDFSIQDYSRYYGSSTEVNRELSYRTSESHLLTAISFTGFSTGGLDVKLGLDCTSDENLADIGVINALMVVLPGVELNASGQIRFSANASDSFNRLLTILSEKNPTFSDISDEIRCLVMPTLTVEYSPSRHRFHPLGGTEDRVAYSYNPGRTSFLLQKLMDEEEEEQRKEEKIGSRANHYY